MAVKLNNTSYDYFDIVFSDTIECPVDAEYFLPDYCPDIQKILKCSSFSEITSYSVTTDKLFIQGNINISVLYTDEKGTTIRTCDISKEFSATQKITTQSEKATAMIKTGTGHVICRAISARKLDIHIPVLLYATVCCVKSDPVLADAEACERRRKSLEVSRAVSSISREIAVTQELALSGGAPPIESIIRRNICFTNIVCRPGEGRINIEGIAEISVDYKSFGENSIMEKMKYQLPFSDVIDCDEATDETICRCDICSGEFSLQPKEDSMGEYTNLSAFVKCCATIMIYENTEMTIVADAYSLGCRSREKYGKQCFCTYVSNENQKVTHTKTINAECVERVLDIWCGDLDVAAFCEPGKITYRGRYTLTVLFVDKDKKICCAEKQFDYSVASEYGDSIQRKAIASAEINVSDFRITGESSVDISCEINVSAFVISRKFEDVLTSIEIMEDKVVDNGGRVTICYGCDSPDLWSVGKKYRVSIAEICDINGISDDGSVQYPLILFRQ